MDIFIINISDADNIKPELLNEFRYKNFSDKNKQKEHCFAYLMLNRILRNVYGVKNCDIEFVNKKPYLKTREKFFSISHSGKYLLIAFSENECGADIEQMKDRDFVSVAKRMKLNAENREEFYKEWTKYEAEYKLGGKYISIFQTDYENYMITALSSVQESFDIYIQNGEEFPNL